MHKKINWCFIEWLVFVSLMIILVVVLSYIQACPVKAYWDDDVWVEHEYQELSDWDSKLELEVFLALHGKYVLVLTVSPDGWVDFDNQCEDHAFALRNKAEQLWGKRLETEILTGYEYNRIYRQTPGENMVHVVNKAIIGNEIWLVEPKTREIWFYAYLD